MGFLGSSSTNVVGIDVLIRKNSPTLSQIQCTEMIKSFKVHEIDQALMSIECDKAPGMDGFYSFFFRRIWTKIKMDVYVACIHFFHLLQNA